MNYEYVLCVREEKRNGALLRSEHSFNRSRNVQSPAGSQASELLTISIITHIFSSTGPLER